MYKYEYEKIKSGLKGFGALYGNIYTTNNYQELIEKRASDGWRYVGYIPTKQRGTGHIQEFDLIFEKKVSE